MNDDRGWFLFRAYQHARTNFTDDLVRALWGNLTEDEKLVWRRIWGDASVQHEQAIGNPNFNRVKLSWEK